MKILKTLGYGFLSTLPLFIGCKEEKPKPEPAPKQEAKYEEKTTILEEQEKDGWRYTHTKKETYCDGEKTFEELTRVFTNNLSGVEINLIYEEYGNRRSMTTKLLTENISIEIQDEGNYLSDKQERERIYENEGNGRGRVYDKSKRTQGPAVFIDGNVNKIDLEYDNIAYIIEYEDTGSIWYNVRYVNGSRDGGIEVAKATELYEWGNTKFNEIVKLAKEKFPDKVPDFDLKEKNLEDVLEEFDF